MRYYRVLAFLVGLCWISYLIAGGVVLNIRDFGAIADGYEHFVQEWVRSGRYASLRALKKDIPEVQNGRWSVDEAAFELAKRALPLEGGAIYFPRGTYVATGRAWTIGRDNVKIYGDGADQTILATGKDVLEGLVLAGYRHVGWSRGYPFVAGEGTLGSAIIHLRETREAAGFQAGQLVFVRNGANKFDQDYGEFNEVKGITRDGGIEFQHPLARDYSLSRLNWAGKIAQEFRIPLVGETVRVEFAQGPGFFMPGRGDPVSIGENVFEVKAVHSPALIELINVGRGNSTAGTFVPAGTLVGKERGLIILKSSTRNFHCEKLTIRGRRKALTVSNSYNSSFSDCVIERVPAGATVSGGIVIDGDGGRFARFTRCEIKADPSCGMQFARSFGGVEFSNCKFTDTNVAFTEFNFDCAVTGCTFAVKGGAELQTAIIVGKSCNNLRLTGNTIRGENLAAIFDSHTDIQSFKLRGAGAIVLNDNVVETVGVKRIFNLEPGDFASRNNNSIRGQYLELSRPESGRAKLD